MYVHIGSFYLPQMSSQLCRIINDEHCYVMEKKIFPPGKDHGVVVYLEYEVDNTRKRHAPPTIIDAFELPADRTRLEDVLSEPSHLIIEKKVFGPSKYYGVIVYVEYQHPENREADY